MWVKGPSKSLPHYIKIIIINIYFGPARTRSSLNVVYDNGLNMHEHQGQAILLASTMQNPLVNNKKFNI